MINEILKTQNEQDEEETDADIDLRISMRNEFIRCGLTDGRVRKIKEEAENDVTVRSDQDLLLKQCNDYINEREDWFSLSSVDLMVTLVSVCPTISTKV